MQHLYLTLQKRLQVLEDAFVGTQAWDEVEKRTWHGNTQWLRLDAQKHALQVEDVVRHCLLVGFLAFFGSRVGTS